MRPKAVALLSGGLDSILAIRIMQEQNIEIEALNFRTVFSCCQETSSQAAHRLGVRLTVLNADDEYLDVIRKPKFGYGRGANPCVDCRIYMFERAKKFMQQVGADFAISGEVVGQRPMSQKKRDLNTISVHSDLDGKLLRPLSAKILPPTEPELNGMVDREALYDFTGRSRKGLIALAREFGYEGDIEIPAPSTGCMLTESTFAPRVHDLIRLDAEAGAWDFELLKIGRHVRYDAATKVIVGRRATENEMLEYLYTRSDSQATLLMRPHDFRGPCTIVTGPVSEESLDFAAALLRRFSNDTEAETCQIEVVRDGETTIRTVSANSQAAEAATL